LLVSHGGHSLHNEEEEQKTRVKITKKKAQEERYIIYTAISQSELIKHMTEFDRIGRFKKEEKKKHACHGMNYKSAPKRSTWKTYEYCQLRV